MRLIVKSIVLIYLLVLSCSYCFAINSEKEIKTLVESFCLQEFQGELYGAGYRDQIIKYTPEMYKKIEARTKEYPYVVYLAWDPLFIVDSYKIAEIKQTDDRYAYVVVNYHQLARSEGWGANFRENKTRKFVKDVRDISVRLNLEYDGTRWWIIDPPYPKVSYDSMVDYYSHEVADTKLYLTGEKGMPGRKSTPKEMYNFQTAYDYEKSILDFLLSLKKGE